ncbi:hypothetical protein M0813_20796 [Anaeramoeba flamelloides]|uniref:Uncharacterized protein n=1 Tax=Anaeramoeba flamelloides TaxID=1746091 RepID=A0ABQ8YJD9_9EUKA|nr:hypothetical protein M0813_20796 [Anaeramoeba flamelloides]
MINTEENPKELEKLEVTNEPILESFRIIPKNKSRKEEKEKEKEKKPQISDLKEKPKIFRVNQSSVFSKLQQFLPQMEKANKDLEEKMKNDPESFHIENTKGDKKVIQMTVDIFGLKDEEKQMDDFIIREAKEEKIEEELINKEKFTIEEEKK